MHVDLFLIGVPVVATSVYFLWSYFRRPPTGLIEIVEVPSVEPVAIVAKPAVQVIPVLQPPPVGPVPPKFLSREKRRQMISETEDDPEVQKTQTEIRIRLAQGSGLVPPDPEAQTNPAAWREKVKNNQILK